MAYERSRMISRPGPSDMSGVWDKLWSGLENGAKSALNFYNQAQQNKGAAQATAPVVYAPAQSAGMSTTEKLALAGGGALLLVVLLRRKG